MKKTDPPAPKDPAKQFKLTEEYYRSLVDLCPDAIIGVDRQGTVTVFNEAAEALTGYQAREILGKLKVTSLYPTANYAQWVKKMIHSPELGGPGRVKDLEVTLRTREKTTVPVLLSAALLMDQGEEVGSVGYFHDLTRTRQLEEISITDSLTSMFNRQHFHSVLAKELGRSQRHHHPLCLVYFDLDHFKPFNDNFGHRTGDEILRLVGRCARELLRVNDYAFRVGGDEFILLLVDTNLAGGHLVAERFRNAFNQQWFEAMSSTGKELRPVSLSMGVAQYHHGKAKGEPGEKADNLVVRADMAMYEAKRAGGDRVVKAGFYIGEPKPGSTRTPKPRI